jgi:hypothetical protein
MAMAFLFGYLDSEERAEGGSDIDRASIKKLPDRVREACLKVNLDLVQEHSMSEKSFSMMKISF